MQEKKAIAALINIFNPLLFVERTDELAGSDAIRLLCAPSGNPATAVLVGRGQQLSSTAPEPAMVPALPILVDRIVSPLVRARVEFIAGHPLGTIALCGFAAEMMALILHEIGRDEGLIKDVTEAEFESYGQQKRVRFLWQRDIIDHQTKKDYELIRETRRRYLHLISQDHSLIVDDALRVYGKAVALLVALIGQKFENGAWVPEPLFGRYLRKRGLL